MKKKLLNLPEKKDIDFNEWSLDQLYVLAKTWTSQLDIDDELVDLYLKRTFDSYESIESVYCKFLNAFDYLFGSYVNWSNDPRDNYYSGEYPF
tara:strand:+ start:50088 stop:50366 length:279 start_codon:yes stop_codon:yes gene_type:complete